jgi:hypothetical protein
VKVWDYLGFSYEWSDEVGIWTAAGDVNGDGFVGGDDLTAIIYHWGNSGASRAEGDLNGDGLVGGYDYSEVLTFWGWGLPAEPVPEPSVLLLLIAWVGIKGAKRCAPLH